MRCKEPSTFVTILACTKPNTTYKTKNKQDLTGFRIALHSNLETNEHKTKLEELFLLHKALKQERNCNNHASETTKRLPKPVVERAIKLYIKKFREIQQIVDIC